MCDQEFSRRLIHDSLFPSDFYNRSRLLRWRSAADHMEMSDLELCRNWRANPTHSCGWIVLFF
jgi:hypothetical protein